jgi:putative phosphoesterase
MRLAIVSDTHLPRFGRVLPRALVEGFEREAIDSILHAGDWTTPLAVDLLEQLAPVDGVAGNNDGPELHDRFGTRRIVALDGVRIGITHGHLGPGGTSEDRARSAFAGEAELDAIVFGHSHIPRIRRPAVGPSLINPGSPTDKRRQPAFTWVVLETASGRIARVELVAYPRRDG